MASQSLSPIVQKLHDYVQKSPTEFEITILPTVTTNKMETDELSLEESVVLVEGHLGMDARSLPWMTAVIRKDYKSLKKSLLKASASASDESSTSASKAAEDINALHSQIQMATNALMLVNPDHSTAWGDRRRALIVTSGDWVREMQFLNLLMTQHSKAPSSWGHRKYVLQQILKTVVASQEHEPKLVDLVRKEIALCSKIAEKFPKNYYAWTHRRYLWSFCRLPHLQSDSETISLLDEEFDALKLWLEQHISDHSAVHYLGQVLEMRLQHIESSSSSSSSAIATDSIQIAEKSLSLSKSLLDAHPDHESLWILRRLMVQVLFQHAQKQNSTAIRSLLESLVDDIWIKAQREEYVTVGATSVYAWSFLVWCMSQLRLGGQARQQRLKYGLKFLQSHSHVYSQMWKTNGEELLLAK